MVFKLYLKTIILFALFCTSSLVYAADAAGKIETLKGDVIATLNGETRSLEEGDEVFANDLIETKAEALAEIEFKDESSFILGPESEFKIDKFSYNGANSENSFSTKLVKGAFRFVTGLIARYKPDSMEVNTAVATIGIRGTTVAAEVTADSATVVLQEPKDKSRKTAIVVSNQYGSVEIDEPGYGTEVPDKMSPPSPPRRMQLRTITNLTRSIQSIQRINRPAPRPQIRH